VLGATADVTGRLLKSDGSPLAGTALSPNVASVMHESHRFAYLLKDSPLVADCKTDQDGRFVFHGIPRGSIFQFIVNDPSVQQEMHIIQEGNGRSFGYAIGDGGTTDLGQVKLTDAGQICGHVFLDGKGVPGVRVAAQAINTDLGTDSQAVWGEAVTSNDGAYTIGGLGNARYNVALFMPTELREKYACAGHDSVDVHTGRVVQDVNLTLDQGGIIEGEVFLKDNPDLENFPVSYYGPEHPQSGAWCGSAMCDKNGHFSFRAAPGSHYVYLAMTGYNGSQTVDVQAGKTVHITLKQ